MAKNRNPSNRNNEERTGSNQGDNAIEQNEQPGRQAADRGNDSKKKQGGERDAGSSRSSESKREASSREPGRQGSNNPEKGRQARETEGLDVDQLDEERENI